MVFEPASAALLGFLDGIREALGVNLVTLSRIGADRQLVLATSASSGISLNRTDIPLGESICRHVEQMNFPLVVSDTLSHPLLRDVPGIMHCVSGAYLGYPVRDLDGRVLAVLAAARDRIHRWSAEEQALMAQAAREVLRFANFPAARRQREP